MLSYDIYSHTYELEYSYCVIILIYGVCLESSTHDFMLKHSYNLYNRNYSKVEVAVHRAVRCAQVLYLLIRRVGDLGEFG